ncbi:MAG: type IV pilin [Euryarchaeota archaeon]|nr:type IV pilin [Euryarchaeota archaeon]
MNNFTSGKDRKLFNDDRGVSPVIAVILMVAITVVMAAIVSSWSAGVKAPTAPTTIGLDITRSTNNVIVIVTSIDPPSAAPINLINISYYNYDGANHNLNYTNMISADVGASTSINTNSPALKKLIVTATYKDGTQKVIYNRET